MRARHQKPTLSKTALADLERFLASTEGAMPLPEAHGFLTALASAPSMIMPSTWQHEVIGEPEFESMAQAQSVIGALMGLWNSILEKLNKGKAVEPPGAPDPEAIARWCAGYLRGTRLDEVWRTDDHGIQELFPFAVLAGEFSIEGEEDAFFKKVFSDTNNAAGELQSVLPTELARRLDWRTLTLQPGSFVDDALQGQHTDLLFSVELDGDKRQVLLYLLFEHFSGADRFTAYRALRYIVRIWEAWRQENEGASTLPAVMPVVLHHDEQKWSAPRQLSELLDLPDELRESLLPYLPQLTFVLDDLAAHDDQQLQDRAVTAMAKLALLLFKHARHGPDLLERLINWGAIMATISRRSRFGRSSSVRS